MSEITVTPTLETQRLILRPLARSDAPAIQRHFNNWNIIKHLAQVVPWPYPEDGAVTFITRELERVAEGEVIYNWMLVLRGSDGEAIGNIRLRPWLRRLLTRLIAIPRVTADFGLPSATGIRA